MIYTLIFGASAGSSDHQYGKLKHIVLNNGIANQFTVDPGLLSYERVVPISDVQAATAEGIHLKITGDDWKAYSAFTMHQAVNTPSEQSPDLAAVTASPMLITGAQDTSRPTNATGARREEVTVEEMSVVLTASTVVVNEGGSGAQHKLKGLIVDTGRPQQLVLDDDSTVPFEAITRLDEERIHIGGRHQQPVLEADRDTERTASRSGASPREHQ